MKNFLKIVRLEFKILINDKLNYIVIPPVLYYLYFSIRTGLDDLTLSGYVVQVLIFGSMIIGYLSYNRDIRDGYDEILKVHGSSGLRLNAKLLANFIYVTCINLLILILILINGIILKEPKWIILESVLYIVLYYFLSSIISIIFGFIISTLIRGKFGFAIVLFVSAIIGPLGKEFCAILVTILKLGDLEQQINAINIGQYYVHQGLNYLYGFEIESKRFLHRFIYIFSLINILYLLWILKDKIKKTYIYIPIALGVLMIPMICYFSTPSFIYKPGITGKDAESVYDRMYYGKKDYEYNQSDFIIKEVDIVVDTRRCLEVRGDFDISINSDIDKLNMTLYRNFKVESIKIDNEIVKFEQFGDRISVQLNDTKKEGTQISMFIHYKGISSAYFYSGDKAVFLPSYFNWLPYPAQTDSMYVENSLLRTTPLYVQNEIEYKIDYKGTNKVISNLSADNNNLKGKSSEGVTLISGHLNHFNDNVRDYYYTDLITKDSIQTYVNTLISCINELENDLGVNQSKINQVFLVPFKEEFISSIDQNIIINTMKVGGTLISGIYPKAAINDDGIYYEAMASVFNGEINFIRQDKEIKELFIDSLMNWYIKKNNLNLTTKKNTKDMVMEMQLFIDNTANNEVTNFFQEWYSEMLRNSDFNENKLKIIISKHMRGDKNE